MSVYKQYPVPPIVQNLIDKLRDPLLPDHVKDNAMTALDEIERAARIEVEAYRKARAKANVQAREEKRKSRAKSGYARVSSNSGKY